MSNIKQILVMRKTFPDKEGTVRKLRTGKYVAQGAHASISFLTRKLTRGFLTKILGKILKKNFYIIILNEEETEWIEDGFTKICVGVETEEELLEIYNSALEAGLTAHKIVDSGHTEFNLTKTLTAVAIGPHEDEDLKPITGHLTLL